MQSLVTFFFERGSFGAFVICLILFGLAVYLTYFRKPVKKNRKNRKNKKIKKISLPYIIISAVLFVDIFLSFFGYISNTGWIILTLPFVIWFMVFTMIKKYPSFYLIVFAIAYGVITFILFNYGYCYFNNC